MKIDSYRSAFASNSNKLIKGTLMKRSPITFILQWSIIWRYTHLSSQPLVWGMKNLRFLDNTFSDESEDIMDKDFGIGNETSVVAMTMYVIVEKRSE